MPDPPSTPALSPLLVALAAVAVAVSPAAAQDSGVIAGRVVDDRNGEPLSTAQVFIPFVGLGTLTDLEGRYRIPNVPAGRYELRFETLGYRGKNVTELEVSAAGIARTDPGRRGRERHRRTRSLSPHERRLLGAHARGRPALDQVVRERPDLVLLDLMLPGF